MVYNHLATRYHTGSSVVEGDVEGDADGVSTVINILSDTVRPVESVTADPHYTCQLHQMCEK